ncbi:MAG: hypothetical protein WA997_15455 [Anaerolineales bacterium]|nr:hypothetical protein [Anaerolineales bacterium]
MAKVDYDGVVQAVHYDDLGQVMWVRAFLRRGAVWSDYIQLERGDLVEKINSGLRFRTGERIPYLGGTFETTFLVELVKVNSHELLVAGDGQTETDRLEGVPLI